MFLQHFLLTLLTCSINSRTLWNHGWVAGSMPASWASVASSIVVFFEVFIDVFISVDVSFIWVISMVGHVKVPPHVSKHREGELDGWVLGPEFLIVCWFELIFLWRKSNHAHVIDDSKEAQNGTLCHILSPWSRKMWCSIGIGSFCPLMKQGISEKHGGKRCDWEVQPMRHLKRRTKFIDLSNENRHISATFIHVGNVGCVGWIKKLFNLIVKARIIAREVHCPKLGCRGKNASTFPGAPWKLKTDAPPNNVGIKIILATRRKTLCRCRGQARGWIVFNFYGEVAEMRYTVYYTVEQPVKG